MKALVFHGPGSKAWEEVPDHLLEVLGRGTDQRRPADVNILDRLLVRYIRASNGRLERIQVHNDQFKFDDAMFGQRRHVVGPIVTAKNSSMDLGVQRLDPTVHHLGKSGVR